MIRIHGYENFTPETDTAVVVGKFDCIHRGHDAILKKIIAQKKRGLTAVVFTFEESPRFVLQKGKKDGSVQKNLLTNEERALLLSEKGVDVLIECPFDDALRHMEPEAFLQLLSEKLCMKYISVTDGFRYGYRGRGDVALLKDMASKLGYEVEIVPPEETEDQQRISSTLIRSLISEGSIEKANLLLGYQYFIKNKIVRGMRIGSSRLKVPTVNMIPPSDKLLPPNGAYITEIGLSGRTFYGISDIGTKPTVRRIHPSVGVETHIFDFDEDVYDRTAVVRFLKFLRPEIRFESFEALGEQIALDKKHAEEYLRCYKNVTK